MANAALAPKNVTNKALQTRWLSWSVISEMLMKDAKRLPRRQISSTVSPPSESFVEASP